LSTAKQNRKSKTAPVNPERGQSKAANIIQIAGLCLAAAILLIPLVIGIAGAHSLQAEAISSAEKNWAATVKNTVLLKTLGMSGEEQVVLGKEGWLYYSETVGDYDGTAALTETETAEVVRKIAELKEYAASNGADFVFLCVPDKNAVYPEYMPGNVSRSENLRNCELISARLSEAGIQAPDLLAVFSTVKQVSAFSHLLYYRTDTHWNPAGAAVASNILLDALKGTDSIYNLAGLKFTEETVPAGDLYRILFPLKQGYETAPAAAYSFSYSYTFPQVPSESLMDVVIVTENPEQQGKLLCYRDSFGSGLIPWLSEQFAEATYIRGNAPYDFTRIGTDSPDCVIFEIAERNLRYILEGDFIGIE